MFGLDQSREVGQSPAIFMTESGLENEKHCGVFHYRSRKCLLKYSHYGVTGSMR